MNMINGPELFEIEEYIEKIKMTDGKTTITCYSDEHAVKAQNRYEDYDGGSMYNITRENNILTVRFSE